MNFKTTYVLFGGFAVLLVALIVVVVVSTGGTDEKESYRLFGSDKAKLVSPADVVKVTIDRKKEGDKLVFERQGRHGWQMTSPRTMTADTTSVESLINGMLNAEFDQNRDAVRVSERGLTSPSRVVTLEVKDGDPRILTIGDVDKFADGHAYAIGSDRPDRAGAVRKHALEAALEGFDFFRAKDVFSGDVADVSSVRISDAKKNVVEVEKTAKGWRAKQPDYGNEQVTVGFLQALSNLRIDYRGDKENDFVGDDPAKVPEAKELLAGDQLRIEVGRGAAAKKEKTVLVVLTGKKFADKAKDEEEKKPFGKPDEKYYAYVEDGARKDVIKLSVSAVEPLQKVLTDKDSLRSRVLVALDGSAPDAVDVQNTQAVDGLLSFRKSPDEIASRWVLYRRDAAVPTDSNAVDLLVNTLSNPNAVVSFVDPKDAKELGLDNPRIIVKVWTNSLAKAEKKDDKKMPAFEKDAKPVTELRFGKTKDANVAVERVWGDQKTIVMVSDVLLKELNKRPLSFYEKTIPPFMTGLPKEGVMVTKVEFTGGKGEAVEVVREKAGERWKVVKPASLKDRPANQGVVEGVIRAVNSLTVVEIATDNPTANDLDATYGLRTPKNRVVVTTKDKDGKEKKHEFDFGNEAGVKGVYAKVGGKEMVYVVDGNVLEATKRELRDTTVLDFDADEVKTVKLTGWYTRDREVKTITLEKVGDQWAIKERPKLKVDQDKVDAALRSLSNLQAVAFVSAGKGFEEKEDALRIEITVGDKKYDVTLGVESGANAYFARSSATKDEVFTVSKATFSAMKESPFSFALPDKP